jgi:uncharacterized protein (DUF433 family)
MSKGNLNVQIIADSKICHGKPTFKGTRIMVWQILELLEDGETSKEIYKAYPGLPKGAVEAALHYAAENAKGVRYVPLTQESPAQAQVFA